jgi:hypothetical protein
LSPPNRRAFFVQTIIISVKISGCLPDGQIPGILQALKVTVKGILINNITPYKSGLNFRKMLAEQEKSLNYMNLIPKTNVKDNQCC